MTIQSAYFSASYDFSQEHYDQAELAEIISEGRFCFDDCGNPRTFIISRNPISLIDGNDIWDICLNIFIPWPLMYVYVFSFYNYRDESETALYQIMKDYAFIKINDSPQYLVWSKLEPIAIDSEWDADDMEGFFDALSFESICSEEE